MTGLDLRSARCAAAWGLAGSGALAAATGAITKALADSTATAAGAAVTVGALTACCAIAAIRIALTRR